MRMTVNEIVASTHGRLVRGDGNIVITGLKWDSRNIEEGDAYLSIMGARVDGNKFVDQALENGAAAVIVDHGTYDVVCQLSCDVPVIEVPDCIPSVRDLATVWRTMLSGKVIAITGSVGKTTTKNLTREVFSSFGKVTATEKNHNNELGVPYTLLCANSDDDFIIVEMGMRGMGQLSDICSYVRPDAAIITNVGSSHIELLGSQENIARAKAEVLQSLPFGAPCVLNADSQCLKTLLDAGSVYGRLVTAFFSMEESKKGINSWPSDIVFRSDGCADFIWHIEDKSYPVSLNVPGKHNIANACSVGLLAFMLTGKRKKVSKALSKYVEENGRFSVTETEQGLTLINDAYNASPESMTAAVESYLLMGDIAGQKHLVLGNMQELGEYSAELHMQVGKMVAEHADNLGWLICVGDKARWIAKAAVPNGYPMKRVFWAFDNKQAIEKLKEIINVGDAVLVKASNAENFGEIIEALNNIDYTNENDEDDTPSAEEEIEHAADNNGVERLDSETAEEAAPVISDENKNMMKAVTILGGCCIICGALIVGAVKAIKGIFH